MRQLVTNLAAQRIRPPDYYPVTAYMPPNAPSPPAEIDETSSPFQVWTTLNVDFPQAFLDLITNETNRAVTSFYSCMAVFDPDLDFTFPNDIYSYYADFVALRFSREISIEDSPNWHGNTEGQRFKMGNCLENVRLAFPFGTGYVSAAKDAPPQISHHFVRLTWDDVDFTTVEDLYAATLEVENCKHIIYDGTYQFRGTLTMATLGTGATTAYLRGYDAEWNQIFESEIQIKEVPMWSATCEKIAAVDNEACIRAIKKIGSVVYSIRYSETSSTMQSLNVATGAALDLVGASDTPGVVSLGAADVPGTIVLDGVPDVDLTGQTMVVGGYSGESLSGAVLIAANDSYSGRSVATSFGGGDGYWIDNGDPAGDPAVLGMPVVGLDVVGDTLYSLRDSGTAAFYATYSSIPPLGILPATINSTDQIIGYQGSLSGLTSLQNLIVSCVHGKIGTLLLTDPSDMELNDEIVVTGAADPFNSITYDSDTGLALKYFGVTRGTAGTDLYGILFTPPDTAVTLTKSGSDVVGTFTMLDGGSTSKYSTDSGVTWSEAFTGETFTLTGSANTPFSIVLRNYDADDNILAQGTATWRSGEPRNRRRFFLNRRNA